MLAVLLAPAAAVAQDSGDFVIPDLDPQWPDLLMAEAADVDIEVTFVAPTGIGAENDLRIGAPYSGVLAEQNSPLSDALGGSKTATVLLGTKTAASLSVRATPGRAITILVGDVVATQGYALADFRCNYNAGDVMPCDGAGYSEIAVADGTLMVDATLFADENAASAPFSGSFAVTVSYQ